MFLWKSTKWLVLMYLIPLLWTSNVQWNDVYIKSSKWLGCQIVLTLLIILQYFVEQNVYSLSHCPLLQLNVQHNYTHFGLEYKAWPKPLICCFPNFTVHGIWEGPSGRVKTMLRSPWEIRNIPLGIHVLVSWYMHIYRAYSHYLLPMFRTVHPWPWPRRICLQKK